MKITKVETFPLMWERENVMWSRQITIKGWTKLLVKIHTDTGIIGIGEAHDSAMHGVTHYATQIKRAETILQEGLSELLIGEDPLANERVWQKMFNITYKEGWNKPGWPQPEIMTAIAGVDMALWDIKGKFAKLPIWKLIGGFRNRIPCYVTGGYKSKDKGSVTDLVEEFEGYVKAGYNAVKVKSGGPDIKEEISRIKAVRQALGPDVKIAVDGCCAWDVNTAIEAAKRMEEFDILWLEEPVHWYDNVAGTGRVAAATNIAIAAGEKLCSRWEARTLIERGKIGVLQYNATLAGGPTEWLKAASFAACHHVRIAPHHEPQTHSQLFGGISNGLLQESFPNPPGRDPSWLELYTVRPELKNSEIVLSEDRPGWGLEYDEAVIQKRLWK